MIEKKSIKRFFKLKIKTQQAVFEDSNIGPILSPFLNKEKVNSFCNEFNEATKLYLLNIKLSIVLYLHTDNTFFFVIKGFCLSDLIKCILCVNNLYIKNDNDFLYLKEFYDLVYYKYFFFNFSFNDFFFKKKIFNCFFSIKNLLLVNDYNFECLKENE